MKILLGLFVFCLLSSVRSQNSLKTYELYNGAFINPDKIYFEDEKQGLVTSETVIAQYTYMPDSGTQQQKEGFSTVVDPKKNKGFVVKPFIQANREHSYVLTPYENRKNIQSQGGYIDIVQHQNGAVRNEKFPTVPDAITNFGLNLFQQVNEVQLGNTVISPYSITMLLALLQQGAKEKTLEQITNALQLSYTKSAETYHRITEDVQRRNSRNILKVANNIFVADSFNIDSHFQRVATDSFKSETQALNFVRPKLAAQTINSWVALKTNNTIEKLLSPDSLSGNTQMVLVNAVYFKGLWQIPFRPEVTLSRPFIVAPGVAKSAAFMRTRRYFKTGVDPYTDAKVIILPFESDEYSLMVILPSSLSDVNKELLALNVYQLASYHNFTAKDVELELPKFTVRADTDLKPIFQNLGITNIFSQHSELYGLGSYKSSSPHVSSALHSAVLSIDERGGSAAAATAFSVVTLSNDDASVKFVANRPFIAVLWDSRTALPLFMAKIVDPTF